MRFLFHFKTVVFDITLQKTHSYLCCYQLDVSTIRFSPPLAGSSNQNKWAAGWRHKVHANIRMIGRDLDFGKSKQFSSQQGLA